MREDETLEGHRLDSDDNSKEHELVLMQRGRLGDGSDQAEVEVFGRVLLHEDWVPILNHWARSVLGRRPPGKVVFFNEVTFWEGQTVRTDDTSRKKKPFYFVVCSEIRVSFLT